MKLQPKDQRVQRFMDRMLAAPAYRWDGVTDPRARRGRRWKLSELLDGLFLGLLGGCRTLREVESHTEELGETGRRYVSRRIPDTTLWELLPRLPVDDLQDKLAAQVRSLQRSKRLAPEGLPCGAISIDGKGIGKLEHDAEGQAQMSHAPDGSVYWLGRVLRAALVSSPTSVCLGQMSIGARTNEMGMFAAFFEALVQRYGRSELFELVMVDAGMTSLANATLVHNANYGYVMALKETQPELLREAKRVLRPLRRQGAVAAERGWEPYRGKRVRRRLYRSAEIAGYHGWTHLRQVWLVEQTTEHKDGTREVEDRYFVTNVPRGRLSSGQMLHLIRRHWGIENDCNWSLDMQWGEDRVAWCGAGRAVETLGLLRLMAYNLLQVARKRHLRRRFSDGKVSPAPAWQDLFRWVRQAFRLPVSSRPAFAGA